MSRPTRPDDPDDRPLAVVTGPTAGLGRVFADRLAAAGHDLLLVARDAARLDAVAGELTAAHGIRATPLVADLADNGGITRAVDALATHPPVAVLVNNAGFGTLGALTRADAAVQARMVYLHCLAPLRLVQAVLPGMVARRRGAIVNVSSVAAFMTGPGNATYSGTKAFLQLWSEGMAAEVRQHGVRVQVLCPGFTRTEFHTRMGLPPSHVPSFLWMTPEAVVDASLAALARGGPVTLVPGLGNRAAVAAVRLVPLRLLSRLMRRAARRVAGGSRV